MDSHELSDIAAAAVTADTIAKVAFTLPAGVLLIVVFLVQVRIRTTEKGRFLTFLRTGLFGKKQRRGEITTKREKKIHIPHNAASIGGQRNSLCACCESNSDLSCDGSSEHIDVF
jgi:uncharacterized membrane protein YiaA